MMLLVFHSAGNLCLFEILMKTSLKETDRYRAVRFRDRFPSPSGPLAYPSGRFLRAVSNTVCVKCTLSNINKAYGLNLFWSRSWVKTDWKNLLRSSAFCKSVMAFSPSRYISNGRCVDFRMFLKYYFTESTILKTDSSYARWSSFNCCY